MEWAGSFSTAIGASLFSNKPLYDGSINTETWRLLHKARTSTLPVNSNYGAKLKSCRKCFNPFETQAHVFCHFGPGSAFRIKHHNDLLDLLAIFVRNNTCYKVIVDQTCEFVIRSDRIDLQLINSASKKMILLDVKIPYDTSSNIKLARDTNIAKYTPLKDDIRKKNSNILTSDNISHVSCKEGEIVDMTENVQRPIGKIDMVTPVLNGNDISDYVLECFGGFLVHYFETHRSFLDLHCCDKMFTAFLESGLCKFHLCFGSHARQCTSECSWLHMQNVIDSEFCKFHTKYA